MNRRSERGATLLIVLWVVCLLAILVVSAGSRGWVEAKATHHDLDLIKEKRLRFAAIEYAKRVLSQNQNAYDSLSELCSAKVSLDQPAELNDGAIAIWLEDEESKINLNQATLAELKRLPDMTDEAASAIVDWRDADSNGVAESAYYASLATPYPCKNAPIESVEELLLVRGVTAEIYQAIRSLVTVYGSKKINFNTVTSPVLAAIGLGEALSENIVRTRLGPDGAMGTVDDRIAKKISDVASALYQAATSADEQVQVQVLIAKNQLGVRSSAFTIHLNILNVRNKPGSEVELVIIEKFGRTQWDIKKCCMIY